MTALTIGLLCGLAIQVAAQIDKPYYANLTWQAPRTLSNWSNLTVSTEVGTYIGMLNDTYPNVRQFLRVPYAQPPIGDLRWRAPQKPMKSNKKIDSTFFGPACSQYVTATQSFWNMYEPTNTLLSVGEYRDQGSVAWSSSEDCLSLAVWTPSYANISSKLPVALFVSGGGELTGAIDIPSQIPTPWVSRSQEHIVVTINYRVNIFGNPKSRALPKNETSLTLLDVRAAVEYVYEHIEAFGGDKDNIMLWGQSQGAILTHLYTLAYPDDPLAIKFGVISEGAASTINLTQTPDPYIGFDIVAKGLGCNYGDDYEAELECMRGISWVEIEEYINRYNGTPAITYNQYLPDNIYIFENETEQYVQGKVAPGPSIRSDVTREFPDPNITAVMAREGFADCLAASDAKLRYDAGRETYRYLWAGNFTNISPVYYLGAFHWSDLLFIFGTYYLNVGEIPELEVKTSETIQDYLLAFLKNASTVGETVGWPAYNPYAADGGTIVEFGNATTVKNITADWLDAGCYNSSVPFRVWDSPAPTG